MLPTSRLFRVSVIPIILMAMIFMVAVPAMAATPKLPELESLGGGLADPDLQTTPAPPLTRPLILVQTYTADNEVKPGKDFNLSMILTNAGQNNAVNIIVTFTPGDVIPRDTGGTVSVYQIVPGENKGINQPMTASSAVTPGGTANVTVNVSYTDQSDGSPYSATFTLSFRVGSAQSSGPARPTATPTAIMKPQLVISGYRTDVDPLQSGSRFNLAIEISNLGNADARGVVMIIGGGTTTGGGSTPEPGGVSGNSGDFSIFAPLNSSNVEYLSDIKAGEKFETSKEYVVNVTANPGAYSLKFSFAYTDPKGQRYVDDQAITLLIYSLPMVEVSFYRPPDGFFVGQPGILPIQVFNLGRKQTVLGNLKVSATDGSQVMNDTLLVGILDPGLYNTLDASVIPSQPGPLELKFNINYTDDFNQARTIEQTMTVEVMDMAIEPIPPEGGIPGEEIPIEEGPSMGPETFWQKVVRFFKGLFGLGSGVDQPSEGPVIEGPIEGQPVDGSSGGVIIKPAVPRKGP